MTNFSSISYIFLFAKNYCQISPSWRIYQSPDVIQAHEEPQDWKLYKADARAHCSLDRLHAFHLALLQELSLLTCTLVKWSETLSSTELLWQCTSRNMEVVLDTCCSFNLLPGQPSDALVVTDKVDSGQDAFNHSLIMAELFTYKTVLLRFDNMTPPMC